MGPAPDRPASIASQMAATVVPNGDTSPRPMTTTPRFTGESTSLPHLVVQVLHGVADGAQFLRLFVGDVDVEFLLERHYQLDGVETVRAEVLHEARFGLELVALDPELLDDDVLHLFLELLHVHCHGAPLQGGWKEVTSPSRRRPPAPGP